MNSKSKYKGKKILICDSLGLKIKVQLLEEAGVTFEVHPSAIKYCEDDSESWKEISQHPLYDKTFLFHNFYGGNSCRKCNLLC